MHGGCLENLLFEISLDDNFTMSAIANNSPLPPSLPIPPWAKGLLASVIIALALYLLIHHLGDVSVKQIDRAIQEISTDQLAACAALTGISFLALGSYDVIAVRMVAPNKASPGRIWLVGAAANAISNTVGFHALTATAVRYRLLTRSRLTNTEIASVTLLSWTALLFGFVSMFSLAVTVSPEAGRWQRGGGLLLLGMLLLGARVLGSGKMWHLGQWSLRLPPGRLARAQMALGGVEMASAIGALYVLMPAGTVSSFPAFSTLYIGAVLLGIASHAPGGLGVFEASILTLSSGQNRAETLTALLLYRLIYNICPFILASLALAVEEIRAALSLKGDNA